MPATDDLKQLHLDYEDLTAKGSNAWTDVQRRSLEFYWTELAVLRRRSFPSVKAAVLRWTLDLHALETFVRTEGQFPRDSHRGKSLRTAEHQRLIVWVDTQRRAERGGLRCIYQRRRLACIPGYAALSEEGVWAAGFTGYETFIAENGRSPRYRSMLASERRAASWAAKQRVIHRNGGLSEQRGADLENLPIWTW